MLSIKALHCRSIFLCIWALCYSATALSQDSVTHSRLRYTVPQKDLIDVLNAVFYKHPIARIDTSTKPTTKLYISSAPIIEFTEATGFTLGVDANAAFNTSKHLPTNTSTFLGAIKYTTKNQLLLPIQSTIWLPGNKWVVVGDWRYFSFPLDAFGYGGYTQLSDKYIIDYQHFRFYETFLRNIAPNWYAGLGYQLDYHWNITENKLSVGTVSDYQKYGFTNASTSSGIAVTLLYDNRKNPLNPEAGNTYTNLQLLQNTTVLGANANYTTLTIDARRYLKMPWHTLLALWGYGVFVVNGNPPYLDLTGSGMDSYNNTSRGYQQGRFIGKNMLAVEAEWRFSLSKNGLLGGVVFANATTVSEMETHKFEKLAPSFGIGLRLKFNKFSKTNIAFDYGVGIGGSRGYVGNLGEVF